MLISAVLVVPQPETQMPITPFVSVVSGVTAVLGAPVNLANLFSVVPVELAFVCVIVIAMLPTLRLVFSDGKTKLDRAVFAPPVPLPLLRSKTYPAVAVSQLIVTSYCVPPAAISQCASFG